MAHRPRCDLCLNTEWLKFGVMELTEKQIKHRVPLWVALSDLFLDTELQAADFCRIAEVMKQAPHELNEIENILRDEVLPICFSNLRSVAGVWTGFDESALVEKILQSKPPGWMAKLRNRHHFRMLRRDWHAVLSQYHTMGFKDHG